MSVTRNRQSLVRIQPGLPISSVVKWFTTPVKTNDAKISHSIAIAKTLIFLKIRVFAGPLCDVYLFVTKKMLVRIQLAVPYCHSLIGRM